MSFPDDNRKANHFLKRYGRSSEFLQIVQMRGTVRKSKRGMIQKIQKRAAALRKKKSSEQQKLMNERKTDRLILELKAAKNLNRDDVTKFALINTKSLAELNVDSSLDAETRALHKLVWMPGMRRSVQEFREKYTDWNKEVPFLLQRLGHQYKNKGAKHKEQAETLKNSLAQSTTEDLETQYEERKERSKKKLKQKKPKRNSGQPLQQALPAKEKELAKRAGVIRTINLKNLLAEGKSEIPRDTADVDGDAGKASEAVSAPVPSSSFFVGGVDKDVPDISGKSVSDHRAKTKTDTSVRAPKKLTKSSITPEKAEGHRKAKKRSILDSTIEEKVHPSWEAKKRQKELQKIQPNAKKIVFQDDDDDA